jgi:hypothetical protein
MIILMGLAFGSYASFTETTKFNQDVANLQNDILILQRSSMLLERDPGEYWIYGLGIDFTGIKSGTGEYTFFKWCSAYPEFGNPETRGEYPYYIEGDPDADGSLPTIGGVLSNDTCEDITSDRLVTLSGTVRGTLNLKDRVDIADSDPSYLLFESVTGRAFLYDNDGWLIQNHTEDLDIQFTKTYGQNKTLIIENLTGRTKIVDNTP